MVKKPLTDLVDMDGGEAIDWIIENQYNYILVKVSNQVEPPVSPIFGGKEYLLCAAIYYEDGKKYEHQPKNIESGIVVCGRRHHNCYMTLASLLGDKYDIKLTHNQGFVTSKNRYLERKEAAQLAFECGQITKQSKTIFSEELW